MSTPSTVRPLTDDEHLPFVAIAANAYPAWKMHSAEERRGMAERLVARATSTDRIYGLFREGRLLGGMRLIDYQMNVRGVTLPTGGVGMVAVDLAHKKEAVAHDLIRFYLERCRDEGMPLATLYPFRIDFYKQMGFGLGPTIAQYSFPPATLPNRGAKAHVRLLGPKDAAALRDCYARLQARTHGLMVKTTTDMERMLANAETRVVGVQGAGALGAALTGYLAFGFDTDPGGNFIRNNLHVKELVYETPAALADLFAFLYAQADQFPRILIETHDESYHHLLHDPRDESGRMLPSVYHQTGAQGLGLMYRVLDTRALFAALSSADFGRETLRVNLMVRDSFLPENAGSVALHFAEGRPRVVEGAEASQHDVELALDISELSSLVMGTVTVERLYLYGLAEVSDTGCLAALDRLFAVPRQPQCLTHF
jgi:predicted acetyltransferase